MCVGGGMHCFEQSSVAVGDTVDGVHVVLIKARLYYCSNFVGMAVYIDTQYGFIYSQLIASSLGAA